MPGSDNPFVVGEQLNYDASWGSFILAGAMTVRTKERRIFDNTEAYHVAIQAQSVGFVRSFVYEVDDIYESFINTTTLRPFRAENRLKHGDTHKQTSMTIDPRRQTARLADGRTIRIPPDTYDLASLLYAFRTIDLTPGRARTLTLLEDNDLHTVRAEPEARDKVKTRTAEYEAFRIAIKLIEGQDMSDSYRLRLYLSNDSRRLPLLLTAEPRWGRIRVELTSATGTRPLDSMMVSLPLKIPLTRGKEAEGFRGLSCDSARPDVNKTTPKAQGPLPPLLRGNHSFLWSVPP